MFANELTSMGSNFFCDRAGKVNLPEVTLKELYSFVVGFFGEKSFTFLAPCGLGPSGPQRSRSQRLQLLSPLG
jgi:hypothetical protein